MPLTLDEISDLITSKIGKTDTEAVSICKDFVRHRYKMIYDSALWKESRLTLSLSITSGTQEIIIPHIMERVIGARWDENQRIWPAELDWLIEQDPEIFERTGDPTYFSELATVAVAVAPGSKLISCVSSSVSDVGLDIQVRGEIGNVEYQETITLNGTTVVAGTVAWERILSLGKPATVGTVTVANSDSTTLVTLWPDERTRQHCRIWLHSTPNTSKTLLVLGKRRIRELMEDTDAPIIRNIDNAILAYVEADMLEYAQQYGKSAVKQQEGHAQLALMRDLDSVQQGKICRLSPISSGEYERSDFSHAGSGDWMKD